MNDLVSIIMPCYNGSKFINEAIKSVINQTYIYWELIIVDDFSTDNSVEIIKSYLIDSRIKLLQLKKNTGPGIARNKAIEQSKGKYIAFLDCDDIWKENKLSVQLVFMRNQNASLSFTAFEKINEAGGKIGAPSLLFDKVTYQRLLHVNVIGCSTAMYSVEKIGKFYMRDIPKGQDFTLWLDILKTGISAKGINEKLVIYRVRKNSVSSNKFMALFHQWKIYRNIENMSLFLSLFHTTIFSYYWIKKRILS